MTQTAKTRIETDSLGEIEVPADCYWGATTQRTLRNFPIGEDRMPAPLIRALGFQKAAAARANISLGVLDKKIGMAIVEGADEVARGVLIDQFPLPVWQTGSGTATNMNANEVIANRANEILGSARGTKSPVHPNDHVNLGQSSNDTIPTAMHIACVTEITDQLLPALDTLRSALTQKARQFRPIVKVGRTHLQDAVPVTLGQEFAAHAKQVASGRRRIARAMRDLLWIAQGATAAGTGLNAAAGFDTRFAAELADLTGHRFKPAPDKLEAIASHDALVALSGTLETLACALHKIANDIRLLGSGPRAGLNELKLPINEPGSSIMPGKANPTQAEALTMVCAQVIGNHAAVSFAGAQGQLELNAYKPVIILNLLQSIALLGGAAASFAARCVAGIDPNRAAIDRHLGGSLMLVTALTPHIGYDRAAAVAQKAYREDKTIRDAALELGVGTPDQLDEWLDPALMVGRR